jgi:hypothetical protein
MGRSRTRASAQLIKAGPFALRAVLANSNFTAPAIGRGEDFLQLLLAAGERHS